MSDPTASSSLGGEPKLGDSATVNRGNAGKGRKRGVPNKTTASVQAALTEAFERRGGVDALIKWAEEDPTEFYKLWGKLIPKDIKAELSGNVGIVHQWRFGDKVIQF